MNNLAETDTARCGDFRRRLLELLAESREPFFDVIIEYGVPQLKPDIDVAQTRAVHPGLD